MEHNSIALQHYPSDYDLLHVEKSSSTPKLVVENNIIRSQTPPVICRHNLKTTPKAGDVICERPQLPKLGTKTGRNQQILLKKVVVKSDVI